MKIGIIGSRGYPHVYSGYETFVTHVAPALARRGHDVTVYCHGHLFDARPVAVDGVKLRYASGLRHKSLTQLTHSAAAFLDAVVRGYDVVLAVNVANGPFGLLLRLAGTMGVLNVDGMEWKRPKWSGFGATYFRFAAHAAGAAFDVLVTDADAMAEVYRRELGLESEVIEYGAVTAVSTNPDAVRALGVEPGEYFLVVGRLVPDNNADLIVQGFAASGCHRSLVVVGDVPYADAYASRVKEQAGPGVIFPGYVRDQSLLQELYCNARAYLHGHEHGGTNPTLLQALASGCAIAALDTVFSREVLAGGRYGLFFDKSSSSVAAVLERLENDDELVAELRRRAPERVAERYTWDRVVDRYETLLTRAINR